MNFSQIAEKAIELGASDIHLSPNSPPIMRINGKLTPLSVAPLLKQDIERIIYETVTPVQEALLESSKEIDFSLSIPDLGRFRVNASSTINGLNAVCRIVPETILSLQELRCPDSVKKLTQLKNGLVLVTGPTGSGKSTTLASIIDYINEKRNVHIVTIEDPIEFIHKSKNSLINQRELNTHTESFAKALRSSLRQDPDVILVGELRDLETISLALTAAETGHLVFATLHTNSAAKTIDRIIDVFPSNDKPMIRSMLSGSLQAVISQSLLPLSDGSGRIAAFEILVTNDAVRNLIRENRVPQIQSIMQVSTHLGMLTLEACVGNYLQQGLISEATAKVFLGNLDGKDKKGTNTSNNRVTNSLEDDEF